jgi:hypothetical protein
MHHRYTRQKAESSRWRYDASYCIWRFTARVGTFLGHEFNESLPESFFTRGRWMSDYGINTYGTLITVTFTVFARSSH